MKKNEEYLDRGMDLKRLVMYFQKKVWIILLLAAFFITAIGQSRLSRLRYVYISIDFPALI